MDSIAEKMKRLDKEYFDEILPANDLLQKALLKLKDDESRMQEALKQQQQPDQSVQLARTLQAKEIESRLYDALLKAADSEDEDSSESSEANNAEEVEQHR